VEEEEKREKEEKGKKIRILWTFHPFHQLGKNYFAKLCF